MIERREFPDEFNDLIKELNDAQKYIDNLTKEMKSSDFEGEQYYKAQITNIYSCINRAWNMRNHTILDSLSKESFQNYTSFPQDIP